MKYIRKYFAIFIVAFLIISFFLPIKNAFASYHYKEWNDKIVLNRDGTINVEEDLTIYFGSHDGGEAYHWFKRRIELNKIQTISDVQVYEDINGTLVPYREGNGVPGTFSAYREGDSYYIKLNYEAKNVVKHFVIKYRILGAAELGTVSFYENDTSFDFIAIPSDNEVTIDKATVDVKIPEGASKDQIKAWGAGLPFGSGNVKIVSGNEVVLTGSDIMPGQFVEFNIVFPEGIVEKPAGVTVYPGSAAERAKKTAEQAARKAKLNGLKNLIGLLLFILIVLWIFLTWFKKGKDIVLPEYAEYLREPPSDLPPAVVGALLKQGVTTTEFIATLLDLAERGYIKIEEMNRTFGRGDYVYKLTNKDFSKLKHFEKQILNDIFNGLDSVRLSDLKNKFSTYLPAVYESINEELVKNDFYEGGNPAKVKGKYLGIGFAMIFGGFFLLFLGVLTFIAWPVLLGGIVVALFANAMPRKSMKGAKERMKWLAFKRYLEDIVKYKKAGEAKELFSKYLPFATVFGIDKHWIKAFSKVQAPAPIWYVPYYGNYSYGNTGLSFKQGLGNAPSNIGNSMKGFSLDSISGGLNSLLNSSASIFTSGGSSGGGGGFSGGGGGFSGGGGFGGGGGGGSSAG